MLKITICCFFARIWDKFRYSCEHDDMQARTMQAYVNNTLVRNFLYEVVTSSDLDAFYTIKTMVLRESEVRRGTTRS